MAMMMGGAPSAPSYAPQAAVPVVGQNPEKVSAVGTTSAVNGGDVRTRRRRAVNGLSLLGSPSGSTTGSGGVTGGL